MKQAPIDACSGEASSTVHRVADQEMLSLNAECTLDATLGVYLS
jgi:hypothetical protein